MEEYEDFGGYVKCKYANLTQFGLVCDYSCTMRPLDKNFKFPCPYDSGTDGKRNGVCYLYKAFEKINK